MANIEENEDKVLTDWSRRLVDALQILDFTVDTQEILGLAGHAAHAVVRPAAPLTTFIVGYAAGLAAAGGKSQEAAVRDATAVALQLCRMQQSTEDPSAEGWTKTGQ